MFRMDGATINLLVITDGTNRVLSCDAKGLFYVRGNEEPATDLEIAAALRAFAQTLLDKRHEPQRERQP